MAASAGSKKLQHPFAAGAGRDELKNNSRRKDE